MLESSVRFDQTSPDARPNPGREEPVLADCPDDWDGGYLPPSPRLVQVTSLQHWLDLCA